MGQAGRNHHVPVIERHPDLELVAVCDQNQDRVTETTADRNVRGYTDTERLLEATALDTVHVATPPGTHRPIAERTLEEGVATLIEKPLATTLENADAMIRAARESDTPACVVHNQQFFTAVQRTLRAVESGRFGEVVSVTMIHGDSHDLSEADRGEWVFDLPGGELGEGLPHQIYLPLAFVGALGEIVDVTRYESGAGSPYGYDQVVVELVDDRLRVPIDVKIMKNTARENLLLVHCEEASFRIDLTTRSVFSNRMSAVTIGQLAAWNLRWLWEFVKNGVVNAVETGGRLADRARGEGINEYAAGHYALVDEFVDAVRSGGAVPVPLEDGRETIRVLRSLDPESVAQ